MRVFTKTVLLILFTLAIGGTAWGQTGAGFNCDDVVYSSTDSIRVNFFKGRPGDTVLMPLQLKNDSVVTVFQFLIEFDTTYLRPAYVEGEVCDSVDPETGDCVHYSADSTFIDYYIAPGNRFYRSVEAYTPGTGAPYDSLVTKFSAKLAFDQDDFPNVLRNVIACNFLPIGTDYDSIPGGRDVIFYLKFVVDENMPHGELSRFNFYESHIYDYRPGEIPDTVYYGCYNSQMETQWQINDTTTSSFQIYPMIRTAFPMNFQADTAYVPAQDPVINSFTATPSIISTVGGGNSSLAWTATNADSVVLSQGTTRINSFTSLNSSYSVFVNATTSYTLVAYGGGKTASRSVQITYSPGSTGNPPTISFSPPDQSYSINQGETVSFTVNSNDADGDQITLSAGNMPNNSTFSPSNPVIGNTSVSGTFSFTPDFNQDGLFVVNFTANDGNNNTSSSVSISVAKILEDRLFSTSAPGQSPVGGLRGTKDIFFPINLVTNLAEKDVYGVQFDMYYPYQVIRVDSIITTERIPEWIVYENLNAIPGEVRVVTYGLNNEPALADSSSAILFASLSLDSSAVPWTSYPIYIENGREAISPDPNIPSQSLVTDSGIVEVDNPGDVNLDKFIDVADAVNIVASIVGTYGLSARQFATADVISDAAVDVFDLVAVVNLIYDIPLPASPGQSVGSEFASVALSYNDIPAYSSDVMTVVSDEVPEAVAGAQLEINYDPQTVTLGRPTLTEYNNKFTMSYRDNGSGQMKILLYHPTAPFSINELIPSGSADLVNIPVSTRGEVKAGDKSKLRLSQAFLSTSSAAKIEVSGVEPILPTNFVLYQNYPNPFNPTTTIGYTFSASPDGSTMRHVQLEIYNILGQKVKTLVDEPKEAGMLHEVTWDGTSNADKRVASGVYLYRLKVGDESDAKKMLLLK